MLESGKQGVKEYIKQHKQASIWMKVMTCMAAVVVFVTTYALILPAITLEEPVFCGYEEHQHTVENGCYEKKLICEVADGHAHSPECYIMESVLLCEQLEAEAHEHSEACYTLQN